VRPSQDSIAKIVLFNTILDINSKLALEIKAKDLCLFDSQSPYLYANKPALFHLSTSAEGVEALIKLLTINPNLADEIKKLRLDSKPANEDSSYSYHIDDVTYLSILDILSSNPRGIEALKLFAGNEIKQNNKDNKKETTPAVHVSKGGIFAQEIRPAKTDLEKEEHFKSVLGG